MIVFIHVNGNTLKLTATNTKGEYADEHGNTIREETLKRMGYEKQQPGMRAFVGIFGGTNLAPK